MDFFFSALKQTLVATLFVVFATAAVYVPQAPTSQVPEAQAAGSLSGIATEFTQLQNNALLGSNVVQNTITAGATQSSWMKENVLDGIGWSISKRIVSSIVRSLIDWVNSGFSGSPAFVTDLKNHLMSIADEEIGRVIEDLGGVGSFICSPFRLDAQVSVATQYAQQRENQTAPTCTVTGIVDNIQGFISGVDQGNGLSDWLEITSSPAANTPYGAMLSAQAHAHARLINAEGEELKLLEFGDGFQSQKVCRDADGVSGGQECSIVKPGRVIADQLNKALGAGQDALIEADEINELISALLSQLANTAMTGVSGLLGLSGGDGFGGYSSEPSYLDNLVDESNQNVIEASQRGGSTGGSSAVITDAIASETEFRNQARAIRTQFQTFIDTSSTASQQDRADAAVVVTEITEKIETTIANITTLTNLASEYNTANNDRRVDILIEFTQLNLTNSARATSYISSWKTTADELNIDLDES